MTRIEKNKSWKLRLKKYYSNIDKKLKLSNSNAPKKTKVILVFLFFVIDMNNKTNTQKNELMIPSSKEIANFVGCHKSYVKRIKAQYFTKNTPDAKVSAYVEKKLGINQFRKMKHLRMKSDYSTFVEKAKPIFSKKYINYKNWKFNKKTQKRFLKIKRFNFSVVNKFNYLFSTKTKRVKNTILASFFKPLKMWQVDKSFWNLIFWFNTHTNLI